MTSVSYFSSLDNDIYNECFKLVFKSPKGKAVHLVSQKFRWITSAWLRFLVVSIVTMVLKRFSNFPFTCEAVD